MKNNIKRIVDILMLISLLVSASTATNLKLVHEITSTALILLVFVHIYLNRTWFVSLKRRPKNTYQIALTAVNALLILSFILCALSGIVMSRNVFGFINLGSVSLARRIHTASVYWFFVLSGIHLGFNWDRFISPHIKVSKRLKPYLLTLGFAIALYGAWVFNQEQIVSYMFLLKEFVDTSIYKNTLLALINNFAILSLWTFLSYQLVRYLRSLK